eukprot:1306666-Amphidinium_carterae.2
MPCEAPHKATAAGPALSRWLILAFALRSRPRRPRRLLYSCAETLALQVGAPPTLRCETRA